MDCFENGQFGNSSIVSIDEIFLVLAGLIKTLYGCKLGNIEVASDLTDVSVLMPEHAATSVVALPLFVECSAIFCSELFFGI